jgi:hypothetical protein
MLASSKLAHLLTLEEAVALIVYGATCERCKETRRVDLANLRDRLGPDVLVRDVRKRLRCRACGSRRVITATVWKDSPSADSIVVHWK